MKGFCKSVPSGTRAGSPETNSTGIAAKAGSERSVEFEPIHTRHHHIGDDQVDGFDADYGEGFHAVGGFADAPCDGAEAPPQIGTDAGVVIDDEHQRFLGRL